LKTVFLLSFLFFLFVCLFVILGVVQIVIIICIQQKKYFFQAPTFSFCPRSPTWLKRGGKKDLTACSARWQRILLCGVFVNKNS